MRLHRLELAAFGPYPDTMTVDFDALGADGLFLLYGETGAGKTTILDAVAYALFGRVPGARQQAGRLRCDHAEPTAAPRVALELTVVGRRLRVVRSPEWARPKLRGDGTTREPAKALLEELREGVWCGLSTRVDEVSQQLQEWLGMSAEQFFQVVLLPQGEFARFLRAESTEREELLERLFGTKRFSDAEAWLAEQRRAGRADVEDVELRLRGLLARLCQCAGVPGGAEPDLNAVGQEWIGELVAAAAQAATAASAAATQASASLSAAESEFELVSALRRRQERRLAAEQERAKVDASRDEQEARREEVAQARRAAAVWPMIRTWRAAVATAKGAAEQIPRAADALRSAAAAAGVDELTDLPALRSWAGRLRDDVALLGALRADEDALPRAVAGAADARQRLAEVVAAAGHLADRLVALPGEIESARIAVAQAERAGERLVPLNEALDRAADALRSAREHDVAVVRTAVLRQQAVAAIDSHHQARDAVLALRQRRLDGIAAELAEGLGAGQPCPVCGGIEHPAPASPASAETVTETAERAAQATEELRRREREAAEAALAEAERNEARLGALAGGRSATELDAEVAARTAEAVEARTVAVGLDAARQRLDALESELLGASDQERSLTAEAATLSADAAQRAAALDALRAKLAEARGEDPSLATRVARLSALADSVDALLELHRVAADQQVSAEAAQRAADVESQRAGFDDAESAEGAAVSAAALAELEAECREYDRRDAATAAALADPELAGLGELTAHTLVDGTAAADALAVARATQSAVAADAKHAEHNHAEVTRLGRLFGDAVAEAEPVRTKAARIAAFADLVAGQGQNTKRMTLRAYVLAARLDEVARCASQRLRRMSGGRYSFVFTDDADSRRVRAGLGLRILDDYSGQARSTKTLSGGESFMASLSLALGLADVVAAEAGGAQLETLFIDEGFGSLDADTLDLVMDTLDELRAGGRVIGLVSHVAEMRQRIPMRLRVRKVGASSRLELEAG